MRIEIVQITNSLERKVFTFLLIHTTVFLDGYSIERRKTTRHKFRLHAGYRRLGHEMRSMPTKIEYDKIPISDNVRNQVKEKFFNNIKFKF